MQNKDVKEILVLSALPKSLVEVQRFMARREVKLSIHTDLRGFLSGIVEARPEYALVSANFVHESLAHLRRLMEEVYRVKIVDFVEDQSMESASVLARKSGTKKINGFLTGPALERFLLSESKIKNDKSPSNIFRQHIAETVTDLFRIGNGFVHQPLTWTNRVTCLQVSSQTIRGHLMVAMGMDRLLEPNLIHELRGRVQKILKLMGHSEEIQTEIFYLETHRVEFKKWAEKSAAFFERSVHNGVEVATAFFEADESDIVMDFKSENDMVSIDIGLIDRDRPSAFEMYIHLPLSDKFLLYVPRGSRLSETQQANLQKRGIARLHIPKTELPALQRDRFRFKCNQLISEFYEHRVVA